jgi:hypothetical protein
MIAVLHDKDILSVRTDKLYGGVIICPMRKKNAEQFRIFILNGKRSYALSFDQSRGEVLKHQSAKTSEALLLRDLIKSLNQEEYVSMHPPVMWEWGEKELDYRILKMTPHDYLNSW